MSDANFAVLLEDENISLPPEHFSILTALSRAVVDMPLNDREDLRSQVNSVRLKGIAQQAADALLEMERNHPDPSPENKPLLLAA